MTVSEGSELFVSNGTDVLQFDRDSGAYKSLYHQVRKTANPTNQTTIETERLTGRHSDRSVYIYIDTTLRLRVTDRQARQ